MCHCLAHAVDQFAEQIFERTHEGRTWFWFSHWGHRYRERQQCQGRMLAMGRIVRRTEEFCTAYYSSSGSRHKRWTQQPHNVDLYHLFRLLLSLAQGMPECSVCTCMLVCAFLSASCTRDRGCSKHPAFPAPSLRAGLLCTPRAHCAAGMRRYVYRRMGGAKRYPSMPARRAMGIASLHPSYGLRSTDFARYCGLQVA